MVQYSEGIVQNRTKPLIAGADKPICQLSLQGLTDRGACAISAHREFALKEAAPVMADDRIDGDLLVLTHEFLSLMLGVRRSGVTTALQRWSEGISFPGRGETSLSSIAKD
jgi:hypothetical protein